MYTRRPRRDVLNFSKLHGISINLNNFVSAHCTHYLRTMYNRQKNVSNSSKKISSRRYDVKHTRERRRIVRINIPYILYFAPRTFKLTEFRRTRKIRVTDGIDVRHSPPLNSPPYRRFPCSPSSLRARVRISFLESSSLLLLFIPWQRTRRTDTRGGGDRGNGAISARVLGSILISTVSRHYISYYTAVWRIKESVYGFISFGVTVPTTSGKRTTTCAVSYVVLFSYLRGRRRADRSASSFWRIVVPRVSSATRGKIHRDPTSVTANGIIIVFVHRHGLVRRFRVVPTSRLIATKMSNVGRDDVCGRGGRFTCLERTAKCID